MKNLNFLNWLRIGSTLRRVGLVLVMCLIAIPQAWGWTAIYFHGDFTGEWDGANYHINYELDGSNSGHYFWPCYTSSGTKHWRLYAQKSGVNYQLSPTTNNFVQNIGTAGYKVSSYKDWANNNFESRGIQNGVIAVHINQKTGGDITPYTWLERPTIYIWHNWNGNTSGWGNNGGSGQKAMTDNYNGTYTYDGNYSGSSTGTNVGIQGSAAIKKYFANGDATINGAPAAGDKCRFTWNSNGYKGYDGETTNRGSLTITKICTITYALDGNETDGDVPEPQEILWGVASTLRGNTGALKRTNYGFGGWRDEAGNHYDAGGTITISDEEVKDITLYPDWVDSNWGLKGNGGDGEIGTWDGFNVFKHISGTSYRGTFILAARTVYYFKIYDKEHDVWWGNQSAFVGKNGELTLENKDGETYNIRLATADAGEYIFNFDSDSKQLTITYPNGTTHPTENYVYFNNYKNWTADQIRGHVYSGSTAMAGGGWGARPYLGKTTIGGNTYYFAAIGSNSSIIFTDNGSNQTGDLTDASSNFGKYYDNNTNSWKPFSFTITLDEQAVTTSAPSDPSVQFNGSTLSAIIPPTRTGYDFQGYWNTSTCDDVKVINADGSWVANASGYTSSSKWIHSGGTATLYAKWTPSTYTISYKDQGNVDFTGAHLMSAITSHTYDAGTKLNKASKAGFVFDGWFKESTCVNNTSFYIGGTEYSANFTLYAKWTAVSLVDLENNTVYKAADMVPEGFTITEGGAYRAGVSSDQRFNFLGSGTSNASSGPMEIKNKDGHTQESVTFTDAMYFKGAAASATAGGTTAPTGRAVQFKIPAAGKLDIWTNKKKSVIYLQKSSTASVQLGSDASGNTLTTKDVTAGTYYLYATDGSTTLFGLRFRQQYAVTYSTNATKTSGDATICHGEAFEATFTANAHYTLPSDVTVTIDGVAQTKGTGYTWTVSEDVGTLSIEAAKVTGAINVSFDAVADSYTVTHTTFNVTETSCPASATYNTNYVATYSEISGYALPETIGVTIGGSPATLTTDYTWSISENVGTLTILGTKVTGNIVVTVNGVSQCSATAPGAISKGTASGGTGFITLTASGSPASNNTWYWQSSESGTDQTTSGATKDVSATGTYYLRSYCSIGGGCWSNAVSVEVDAADLLTIPTASMSAGAYTVGGSALNLSSLLTNNSPGSVTYTVTSAGTTGASIDGSSFTATAAGTATVQASIAATGNWTAKNVTATITVSAYSGSSSINIEKWVLDNRKNLSGLQTSLTAAHISYDLSGDCSLDSLNDGISDGKYKKFRNYPYLGLKIKNSGSYVSVNLPKDKELNVKFGYIEDSVKVFIGDTEIKPSPIKSNKSNASKTYTLSSSGSNRTVKFQTPNGKAVVIKQIMVGKSLESITLPAKITLGATTNGTISVDNTIVDVGSDVAITVTPSSGYELDELTVTRDTTGSPSVSVTNNEFTMPNNNVTINATFVLSGHSVTAVTSTGDDTYGTVSAAASTVAEGGTTVITAVPATGYKVINWAVSGEGSSISPSGESNSNTTTLTMGSADATVTVTFGPKTYTLTLDKNGGSADGTATATYNQHSLASITDATCALTHYTLGGYYTEADGGVLLVTASGSPRNLSAEDASHDAELAEWLSPYTGRNWIYDDDITLYAHWWTSLFLNPNTEYHGTGTTQSAKAIYNGSSLEDLPSTTGEDGYTLMGYYTTPDGGTKVLNANGTFAAANISGYISGGKWIYSGASYVTLYAHWAQLYTVTYDGNGKTSGTVPSAIEDQSFGTEITVATKGDLAKTGYTFVGWNTADDGSGSFYAVGSKFTLTGNMTLYAQWENCSGGSDPILSIGASEATESTFLGTYSTEGITISSTSSWGSGYVEIKTSASDYDKEYLEVFASSENISKVSFLLTGNGASKTLQPVVFGWAGDASATAATYRKLDANDVDDKTYAAAEWFTYDFSEASVKRLRIYKASKNVSSTSPAYTGSSDAIGNGQTFYVWGLKVWLGSGGGCTTHTVSFADMSDFAGESTLPSNITGVLSGSKIAEPVIPTATGYVFGGWYKEGACTNPWNFDTDEVTAATTLYAKWVDVSGKYTFHYGGGEASDNTWMIIPFTQEGTSNYYNIEDFIVPNTAKYPSFFVGYEGKYDTENAKSAIYEWDATYGSEPASGRMPIRHNETLNQSNCPLSADGQMADGAKGNLRIFVYGELSANCYVGFYPSGFALDWERGTTVLHSTTNPKVFETDVVTLTAAEAEGNFKVKLATEDSYVAYSRTATETAEGQLNDRKVEGETYDIAEGTIGRFQINLSKKDNNFGLRFVPLVNRTSTSGNWETDDNWTLWRRPTIDETAYVAHFTTIKTPTAQAKKVIVDKTSGVGYPKLYIASGADGVGGLLVENHIQVLKMVDDEPTLSDETTYSELEINSSAYGTGALIMGDASTTTAAYTALYTKAVYSGEYGWVNQYIGTPSASGSIYDFYGTYLYVYSPVNSSWVQANRQPSSAMPTFKAYNLMREESAPGIYTFYDPLVFPGITDGKQKVLTCDDENDETAPEDNRVGAYMFANSWTAPIDVKAMETSDFDGANATIYIFNAGSPDQAASAGDPSQTAEDPGQWVSIPVNAAPYLPENLTVIPSMQAFRIVTTEATASLTLDYKKHVYDPAKNRAAGIEIKPLRAPKHNDAKPNILKLFVEAASGYRDNLYLFERQDFSETFDNGWDGSKMFGISNAPQIYGVNGELKTSINAIPDLEGQQVGFKTGKADSEYTITFNYEGDDTWYFNDTKEHESTLISNNAEYTFTTEPSEDSNRFYISATPIMKVTTGVENVQSDDVQSTKVHKVLINDHIYIIRGGRMYDATGKMLK